MHCHVSNKQIRSIAITIWVISADEPMGNDRRHAVDQMKYVREIAHTDQSNLLGKQQQPAHSSLMQ